MKILFNNLKVGDATIDFTLTNADRLAIIGKNGVGKTTLLRTILGIAHSDFKLKNSETIAAVFQGNLLDNELSIFDNLKARAKNKQVLSIAVDILNKLGLTDLKKKYGVLSGGEKRMVDFARAAMLAPGLLILDELSSGMDVSSRNQVWDIINSKLAQNTKIIFTTHHLEELKYANKLLFINEKKYSFFEKIDDFLDNLPRYKLIIHKSLKYGKKQLFFNHFEEAMAFAQSHEINLDDVEILNPTYNDLFDNYFNSEKR